MKFDLSDIDEVTKAFTYLTELSGKHDVVEVVRVSPKRSLSQNNYLHLLLGAFGAHFGYTIAEAKLIYKELNADIYAYNKKGRKFYLSSADLSTADMAKTVDKFMKASAEQGYELPLATDEKWLLQISNEIERSQHFL